ncbi:hypothetical protein HY991_05835 [Candidatus Micrarchaeota archaeon]|nr:hypothetical protein [Candidatus Micrarchaeota archaeon]
MEKLRKAVLEKSRELQLSLDAEGIIEVPNGKRLYVTFTHSREETDAVRGKLGELEKAILASPQFKKLTNMEIKILGTRHAASHSMSQINFDCYSARRTIGKRLQRIAERARRRFGRGH